jgi:hypothetical protein
MGEQEEGSEWVSGEQREGSEWMSGEQEESKRGMSVIEMFQYENKYLPIM